MIDFKKLREDYICGEKFRLLPHLNHHIVYTDADFFLPTMDYLRKSSDNFIVVSHNGDYAINEERAAQIPSNVIEVYAQNNTSFNPKVISLPIGIANTEWAHGNIENFVNAYKNTIVDNYASLAYLSAKVDTNRAARLPIKQYFETQNWCEVNDGFADPQLYYERVRKSFFNISPPGNGADCHRIWETMYLGRVPVVQRTPGMEQFEIKGELPILFVDDLTKVTDESLNSIWNTIGKTVFNTEKLWFSYWANRILNAANKL